MEDIVNKFKTILLVSIFALSVGAGGVQAALVNFTLDGTVNDDSGGNGFGLTNGDSITATGVFDDSAQTGVGSESVSFGLGSGNSLNLVVGSESFTQLDDVDYDTGNSPTFSFTDGSFTGFNFLATFGTFGSFSSVNLAFDAGDDNFNSNFASGTWGNYSTTVVPVPAAVWLFGSGLIGLVGVARRKK